MFTDNDIMPYGEHKGTKMGNVPPKYLLYVYHNHDRKPFNREVFNYIEDNLDVLEAQVKREQDERNNRNYNYKNYLDNK